MQSLLTAIDLALFNLWADYETYMTKRAIDRAGRVRDEILKRREESEEEPELPVADQIENN